MAALGQTEWDKARAKAKAKAAKTIASNAEKAEAGKRKALGLPAVSKAKTETSEEEV